MIASYARSALTPQVIKPGQAGQGGCLQQYASGTESAAPGFALVGEHGPELVYFNGGEQVMTAEETAAMRGGLSAEMQMVSFAPQLLRALNSNDASHTVIPALDSGIPSVLVQNTFHINGNATSEVIDSLNAYGDSMKEIVRDAIEELLEDRKRTVYK